MHEERRYALRQYAFLLGEIDRAVDQLDARNYERAREILTQAEESAEEDWLSFYESPPPPVRSPFVGR